MLRAVFLVLLIALLPSHLQAEARLALLIGNQYYNPKVGPLKNPHTDVELVSASLKLIGFEVTILRDANYREMDIAIKRFVTELRTKGKDTISFFYYSGHGAANPDTQINYLIPVDIADPNDGNLWYQSFQQNELIDKLSKQAPNATHYVVFDACRNELNLSRPAAKTIGAEKGFVPVAQTPGLLIAYSTAQGKTATDLGDNGGPYARALAEELIRPGVEAVTMFRSVQLKVKQSIGQDPWLSFPSLPEVYFSGRPTQPGGTPAAAISASQAEIAKFCQSVATNSSIPVVQALLDTYRGTPLASCAKARLDELKNARAPVYAPSPQPSATHPPALVLAPLAPKAPAPAEMPRSAASIECSKRADNLGLHDRARREFRSNCIKDFRSN